MTLAGLSGANRRLKNLLNRAQGRRPSPCMVIGSVEFLHVGGVVTLITTAIHQRLLDYVRLHDDLLALGLV